MPGGQPNPPPEVSMKENRLDKQMAFVVEIDRVKHVLRRTVTIDPRRNENDAEHSWHLAVMVMLLSEYVETDAVDLSRVLRMVLIHDLVEIDAGDTYCYDDGAGRDRLERETRAADRIFSILPGDQAVQMRSLWEEFEERKTADARFAAALDRLQPLLLNFQTQGKSWKDHGVTKRQVLDRNRSIRESSEVLWQYASALIERAVELGYLAE
jgi:putative hydrolase of HD superfamily